MIYIIIISVYISSQPESIDFDQESNSSFDASLINELMTNCQNNPPVNMSRKVFHKSHTESLRTNAKCNSSVIEKWYNFALDVNQNLEKGGCGTQMLQADCIDEHTTFKGQIFKLVRLSLFRQKK